MDENIISMIHKLVGATKCYGAPDKSSAIAFKTLLSIDILQNTYASDFTHRKTELNKMFTDLVNKRDANTEYTYSGGFDFYYKLVASEIKSTLDVTNFLNNYKVPENIVEISNAMENNLEYLKCDEVYLSKMPTEERFLLIVYTDQNMVGIYKYNKSTKDIEILERAKVVDSYIINHLHTLKYNEQYLGTKVNNFLYIPANTISEYEIYRMMLLVSGEGVNSQAKAITAKPCEEPPKTVPHADTSDVSDIAKQTDTAEQANRAEESEETKTADIANELSEEGINKVVDKFTASLENERDDILELIAKRAENIRANKEEERKWAYKAAEFTGEYTTLDLYEDTLIEKSIDILENTHRLLITGNTGSGKSELAYLLANWLTGENIGRSSETTGEYKRICVVMARDTVGLMNETGAKIGQLSKFIKYIKDNDIQDKCVLICNEVQASDMGYLLGKDLWEEFNSYNISNILPKNLYLIFTGCKDRDFGIDKQVTERISTVEVSYISRENEDMLRKLRKYFVDTESNPDVQRLISKIIDKIAELNAEEAYQIVSMRKFKNTVQLIKEIGLENIKDSTERFINILDVDELTIQPNNKHILRELKGLFE